MRTAQMYEEDEEISAGSAEFSLGMGSLIGIFFGLALVCGVFFGFGYMMGHRTPGPYVSAEPLYESTRPSLAVAPKPSAQIPDQPANANRVVVPNTPAESGPAPTSEIASIAPPEKVTAAAPAPPPVSEAVASPRPQPATRATAKPAVSSAPPPPAPVAVSAPATTGIIMVQIAAVKSHSDAEALAAALQKNGFSPTIHSEAQDKLLHVQIGPFASREQAKAMRQKLAGAGYDAFIK
jgi:DedD protein